MNRSAAARPALRPKSPAPAKEQDAKSPGGPVSTWMRKRYLHYNAGTVLRAAEAYKQHIDAGGAMMVSLAGAMSTAQLGIDLAAMIRADKIHAISCTGANLEEDLFNLIGRTSYEELPEYRDLSPEDDTEIYDEGLSRVTDTAIPDAKVFAKVVKHVLPAWQQADRAGTPKFPHEFLYELLVAGSFASQYCVPKEESWLLAAAEKQLPIVVPGWEDSTLGNAFASACLKGDIAHITTVRSGLEYMTYLAGWYAHVAAERDLGFFQIGGGIAGDFPICVVPMLHEELKRDDLPFWRYFCQVTDAVGSYGGYSGALPTEKITWGKLKAGDPNFAIDSDATIVMPLVAAIVLNA